MALQVVLMLFCMCWIRNFCNTGYSDQCELQMDYGTCSASDQCNSGICCGNATTLFCISSMCDLGEYCTSHGDCDSGYCNITGNGQCTLKPLGEFCSFNTECDGIAYCCGSGRGNGKLTTFIHSSPLF
jgi:hypothetical protein